jgi:hypothetical protein
MTYFDPNDQRWFSFYKNVDELDSKYQEIIETVSAENNVLDESLSERERSIPSIYPLSTELNSLIQTFTEFKDEIDSGGSFKKAKLKLSEDKRFTFSFSLASKGLFRIPEYFSEELAKEHPNAFNSTGLAATDPTMVEGVVNPDFVETIQLAQGQVYFMLKYNDKEYPLRQQQKGSAYILKNNPTATLSMENSSMFYAIPSAYDKVNLAFSSSFKKSYIEMPKQGGQGRAVDIYIPYDLRSDNENINTRMTSTIPLILAAEYFMQSRIKVRLNIVRPIGKITRNNGRVSIFSVFTIKDFDDPIDWNKMAILRGIYDVSGLISKMSSAIVGVKNNEIAGRTYEISNLFASNNSRGRDFMTYNDEQELQLEFARFKNWMYEQVEKGELNTKLVDKPLMLILPTTDLLGIRFSTDSVAPYTRAGMTIRNRFNELLDMVDLYYNPKASQVISRIEKRFTEEGFNTIELKNYLNFLAGRLYRDNYPRSGVYSTPTEELEKLDEKYLKTIQSIKTTLESKGL